MAEPRKRGRFYTPPATVRDVPGLELNAHDTETNYYVGTAEAIVASGIARLDQLPGQAGLPATVVSYRPEGATKADGFYGRQPGFVKINRRLDGRYGVALNVDAEERARRQVVVDETKRQADAAANAVLAELPSDLRAYLEVAIAASGRYGAAQAFRNEEWLRRMNVSRRTGQLFIRALDVFDQAELERDMILKPDLWLRAARAQIGRVARGAGAQG